MVETVIVVVVIAVFASWVYRSGKRDGSKKGFHVGLCRRRRSR